MKVREEVRAVIFDEKNNEKKILLVKPLTQIYRWRLVKGEIEPGEEEVDALLREIYEEVGLKDVKVLGKLRNTTFCARNIKHLVSSYAARVDSRQPINYQRNEIYCYCWFGLELGIRKLYLSDEKKDVLLLKQRLESGL